jgi:tRNA1Val (adenine37-N6)-methyltransferase
MRTDSGKRNEADAKYIARYEVCGGIADFTASAARLLKYGGKFYCVYRPDRLSSLLSALAASKLEPKEMTFVHADEESEPSMVLICATKGGKADVKVTAPLFMHDSTSNNGGKRELSKKAQKIYDTMSFWED